MKRVPLPLPSSHRIPPVLSAEPREAPPLVIAQIAELILWRDVLAVTLLGDSLPATVSVVALFFLGAFGDTSRFGWARVNLVHHPGSLQSKALDILGEGGLQLFHRLPRCRLVAFGDNTRTQFSNAIFSRHQPLPRWSSRPQIAWIHVGSSSRPPLRLIVGRYLGRCCSSHPGKTVFFVLDEQLYTRRRTPFFLRQSSHTP